MCAIAARALLRPVRTLIRWLLCFAFAIAQFRPCRKRYICRLVCSVGSVAGLLVCTDTTFLSRSVKRHLQPLKLVLQPIMCTAQFGQVVPLVRSVFAQFVLIMFAYCFVVAFVRTYIAHIYLQKVAKIVTKESKQIIENYYLHMRENVSAIFEG